MTTGREAAAGDLPVRSSSCASDLLLDAMVARSLRGEPLREVDAHLRRCRRCRERLALFERQQSATSERVEAMIRIARAQVRQNATAHPTRMRAWLAGAATLVGAAVILLLLVLPDRSAPVVRMKGTSVEFVARHDGAIRRGVSGDVYPPGTSLQLAVTADRSCYLFVVGVEETGKISAYYPFGGTRSAGFEAGIRRPLPHSLILDDSLATEYLLTVLSSQPLELERIRAAIRETARRDATTYDLEGLRRVELPASVHIIEIRKR